jgi:NAD(P)-dependent dehydrogenase (short-subunit alcohol dehydrogenase family)
MTKRVLVTGGATGIGLAVAAHFAAAGAAVCVVGRRAAVVAEAMASLHVDGFAGDVLDHCIAERAADRLGGLDVLVNAAGVNDDELAMVLTNVLGAYRVCRAALECGARHVVLFSGGGVGGPAPGVGVSPLYTATKAAVVQLAECLARAHPGARVNACAPGAVATAMTGGHGDHPDKAVALIAWLCSDACDVTGQLVSVRGYRGRLRTTP